MGLGSGLLMEGDTLRADLASISEPMSMCFPREPRSSAQQDHPSRRHPLRRFEAIEVHPRADLLIVFVAAPPYDLVAARHRAARPSEADQPSRDVVDRQPYRTGPGSSKAKLVVGLNGLG